MFHKQFQQKCFQGVVRVGVRRHTKLIRARETPNSQAFGTAGRPKMKDLVWDIRSDYLKKVSSPSCFFLFLTLSPSLKVVMRGCRRCFD